MLQRDDIKAIYDKVGERQDRGAYYEDAAIADMLAHANLEQARRIVEVGSGTGRVASRMLGAYLNPDATYYALDLSSTMVRLTYARLAAWAKRVLVMRTDSIPNTPIADHSVDRFIALYVFDLLPPQDIQHMLAQAHRVLRPDGRLCLVSLTYGATPYARLKSWGWQLLYALRPQTLGGCRPVRLSTMLRAGWDIQHHAVVTRHGITSEIIIAMPGPGSV